MGPGKDTHGTPVPQRRKAVGGPKQAPRDTTTTTKPRLPLHALVILHGSGAGLSKPQVHEATTELGDKVETVIASDRIVDPL